MQLFRGLLDSLYQLRFVVMDRLLHFELRFVVLLEQRHRALRRRDAEAEPQQRLVRHFETGQKSFAVNKLHAEVAQTELVDPVACPREYRQMREMRLDQRRSFYRCLEVVDGKHEQACFPGLGRVQQIET